MVLGEKKIFCVGVHTKFTIRKLFISGIYTLPLQYYNFIRIEDQCNFTMTTVGTINTTIAIKVETESSR